MFIAVSSPLLKSRDFVHIVGGLAGVLALVLLLIQPVLATAVLKGISPVQQRRWHLRTGILLVISLLVHIGALYLTSPDDMTDALLLRSATPFSVYGVIGLWGILLTATLVTVKSRLKISSKVWKGLHVSLAVIVAIASIVHALWIQGAMGVVSKWVLSAAIVVATGYAIYKLNGVHVMRTKSNNRD